MANEDQQQGGGGEGEKPEFVGLVLELRVSIDVIMEQADSTTPEKIKQENQSNTISSTLILQERFLKLFEEVGRQHEQRQQCTVC